MSRPRKPGNRELGMGLLAWHLRDVKPIDLVEEGTLTPYTYSDMQDYKDSQDENKRRYWLTAQTSGAAPTVQRVLTLSGAAAKLAKVRDLCNREAVGGDAPTAAEIRAILENQS